MDTSGGHSGHSKDLGTLVIPGAKGKDILFDKTFLNPLGLPGMTSTEEPGGSPTQPFVPILSALAYGMEETYVDTSHSGYLTVSQVAKDAYPDAPTNAVIFTRQMLLEALPLIMRFISEDDPDDDEDANDDD